MLLDPDNLAFACEQGHVWEKQGHCGVVNTSYSVVQITPKRQVDPCLARAPIERVRYAVEIAIDEVGAEFSIVEDNIRATHRYIYAGRYLFYRRLRAAH